MGNRKPDTLIVSKKPLTTVEGKSVHFATPGRAESCRQGRAENMVEGMPGIQYNIAKVNRTDRRVQNLASHIGVTMLRDIHQTMDKNKNCKSAE